ncbi:MAG TPA: hypothetical protein VIY73_29325, partial [Polyangiaceae bacterium]
MSRIRSRRCATGVAGLAAIAACLQCGGTSQPGSPSSPGASPAVDAGTTPTFPAAPAARWSDTLGNGTVTAGPVAVAADGSASIAATLSGSATVGSIPVRTSGGMDVLLARLDSGGDVLWAHAYGDAADQSAHGATVDAQGNTIVVGTFAGTLDFTGSQAVIQSVSIPIARPTPPSAVPLQALGTTDAFVAKLDPRGNLLWATQLGGQGATAQAQAVAIGPKGEIAVTGSFDGRGAIQSSALDSSGGIEGFAMLLGPTGTVQWMRELAATKPAAGTAIAMDGYSNTLIAGTYAGFFNLDDGALDTFGGTDVFVAELDVYGNTLWSQGMGSRGNDRANGVAFDANGNGVLLASFVDSPELAVLSKYDPFGNQQWSHAYGGLGAAVAGDALAIDPQGTIYVAGDFRAPFRFGSCSFTTSDTTFGNAFLGVVSNGQLIGQAMILHPSAQYPDSGMVDMKPAGAPETLTILQAVSVLPAGRGCGLMNQMVA